MDQAPPNRAARLRLQRFLPVVAQGTLEPLGRLVDLSMGGMMLIATRELPVGQVFELEIRTPPEHPVAPVRLAAEAVWCRNNPNNPQHFGVGFRFIQVSDEALAQLEHLMREAGTLH